MSSAGETKLQPAGETGPAAQRWEHTYHLSAPVSAVLERLRACVSPAAEAAHWRLEVEGETFALFRVPASDARVPAACVRGVLYSEPTGTRLEVRWGGFVTSPVGLLLLVFSAIAAGAFALRIGEVAALVVGTASLAVIAVGAVKSLVQRDGAAGLAYAELRAALDGIVEPLRRDDGPGGYR